MFIFEKIYVKNLVGPDKQSTDLFNVGSLRPKLVHTRNRKYSPPPFHRLHL